MGYSPSLSGRYEDCKHKMPGTEQKLNKCPFTLFSVNRELGGTWLYQFSNAAVTTDCKFSGSKPLKLILLQFRKSEVRNESNGAKSKVWAGRLLLEAPEEVCFLASPYRMHFLARGPHLILSGPASPPTSHCGHATFSLRLS